MDITEQRDLRFKEVIKQRQPDLTVVLENVHDPHNIGAVLRSCDAVGITEIYVLYTEPQLTKDHFYIGKSSSSGAGKWVETKFFTNHEACFTEIKKKYVHILVTAWEDKAKSLYDFDLTLSTALVFGNEKDGVSEQTAQQATGFLLIPQMGMVQSLNISVACAVCLFETLRQRMLQGKYSSDFDPDKPFHQKMYQKYLESHHRKRMNKAATRKSQVDKNQ